MQVPLATRPEGVGQAEWTAVCRINDAILKRVRYDHDRARFVSSLALQSPQETLRRGLGVCMDYAALFEASARRVNLKAKSVVSDSLNHAWNAVQLGGVWWNVDVTWNAGGIFTSGGAVPDCVRHDVDFRRRYLLTTPAFEAAMLRSGLMRQTHLVDDVRDVNYTRTLQAIALIAQIERLIDDTGAYGQSPAVPRGPNGTTVRAKRVTSAFIDNRQKISRLYEDYLRLEGSYPLAVTFRLESQPGGGPARTRYDGRWRLNEGEPDG
ncbi:transglutaminase domain-containing protein [Arthrobacter sp. LjRoot14]|uniref:transglutaminase domain-containing protein n=1 Tax=Arthrobacter sp. LjRoot14 TaxID=3342265 RepID=UPI003F50D316